MRARRWVAVALSLVAGIAGFWLSIRNGGGASDLDRLVANRDWFALRDAIGTQHETRRIRDIHRAWSAVAFDQNAEAIRYAQLALRAAHDAGDAHEILVRVYNRQGRYREALKEALALRTERGQTAKSDDFDSLEALWSVAAQWPPPSVAAHARSKLRGKPIDDGVTLPVLINGRRAEYPVDTGTSSSGITPEEAARLGLEVKRAPGYVITDANGVDVPAGVTLVKDLIIGKFHLRNVLFHVQTDDLGGRGLIGMNIIEMLETIRWDEKGEVEIGFDSAAFDANQANLCIEEISESPIVNGRFQGRPIRVYVDSGGDETEFLPLFGSRFPDVRKRAEATEMTGHSAGGEKTWATRALPLVRLELPGGAFEIEGADLLPDDYPLPVDNIDVWLGFDALQKGASFDFRAMRFSAR